jgi:hypothetical protein
MKHEKTTRILRVLLVTILALAAQPIWAQNAFVSNPSFEDNYTTSANGGIVPDGWTTVGGWGVNQAGDPFYNDGTLIPDRDRFAFIWHDGTMSQEISGLTPGKQYWLQFWYQGRNCCGGTMEMLVSFSGVPIGAVSGVQLLTGAFHFANMAFTPTNDTGTVTFQTTVTGDASANFDAMNIVQRDPGNVVIMNPSFEASGPPTASTGNPPATDSGEVIAPALMAGWEWSTNQPGAYGVSLLGGVYADNGAIPDQDLVGFISGPGSLSQTVSGLVANTPYQLSFSYNAQSAPGADAHLQVIVAGKVIDDENVAPVGGSNPYHTKTLTFTPASATALISFAQTNANGTLLLDNVSLVGQVPAQYALAFAPTAMDLAATQIGQVQVTVPSAFLAFSAADINITTPSPTVVGIVGANSNGVLTLHFAQGAANVQTFQIVGVGRGSAGLSATATTGLNVVEVPTVTVWTSFVLNPSFEYSAPGVASIPCWTGGSGVNNSSGPSLDNGIIPDQAQVAVLQGSEGSNTLSQQIYGLTPGKNYWLQFRYNAGTVSFTLPAVDLQVKLGGNVLATITNITAAGAYVGDVPFYFTNIVFVPANASELLEFVATPTVQNTTPALLLDAVSIVQRDADEIVIENPSFEASGESSPTSFTPPMDGWSLTGDYGVNYSPGDTLGDNGIAPDQGEVLFLYHSCAASNLISGLTVGQAYTLSYGVNARNAPSGSVLAYDVAFGDIPLLTGQEVSTVGDDNPYFTQYLTFTNDAPSNVLGFATQNVGDTTTLLDNIKLVPGLRVPPQLVSSVLQPALQFVLAQGSYPFNTNTFQLLLDGANVASKSTVTTTTNGIMITYAYSTLPAGTNTVELIVSDKNSPPMTIDAAYSLVTLPPTALSISLSAGMVVISWPVSATGFVLQETSAMPGGWTNSAAPVTVQGSQNVVDISPTGKSKFYRLEQ